jgi:cytoplasmic tRNA 2-thiolation protein 1
LWGNHLHSDARNDIPEALIGYISRLSGVDQITADMAPAPCAKCKVERAMIIRPKNHMKLCKECFISTFEAEIHHTITTNKLFHRGERVAIGASGGKDSTVLASVLKTLNERHDYGVDFCLLSIDEGIRGYRDDSLETVKRNAVQYEMELCIVGYDELYGWTMDQVVEQVGKKGNCTYCGVFRRQALDRGAAKLGITHVVTGHNADDIAETVMMNCKNTLDQPLHLKGCANLYLLIVLRGDLPRLSRTTHITTSSPSSTMKRSKPLKYAYEKEIVLYAHHKKLEYFSTECIYSPEAFRGSARALIKNLERIRPSAILDIVRSGEDMAKLVPEEVSGIKACAGSGPKTAVDEGEETGGCGSANGRSSGGEMASMEKQLAANQLAEGLEVEITSGGASFLRERKDHPRPASIISTTSSVSKKDRTPRKLPSQKMGQCTRCGYLSSQAVCKACMLLEGLNKNRPKMQIEIGLDDDEISSSLQRRMELATFTESAEG